MPAKPKRGGIGSSLLVLLGAVVVLGATFGTGVLAGRYWSRADVLARSTSAEATPDGSREGSGTARSRAAGTPTASQEITPALTFYQELKAPLEAAITWTRQDPAKSSKAAKPDATSPRVKPDPSSPGGGATEGRASPPAGAPSPTELSGGGIAPRFTVQVAAYRTRAQADALREKLAARGIEADVTEAATSGGTRYRVRVGSYPTRAAAQAAAARLVRDARVEVFVATR